MTYLICIPVFGVDLEFLLERENGTDGVELGTIPSVMERCLLEVETRGLSEVGICTSNNPDCMSCTSPESLQIELPVQALRLLH